MGGKSTAWARRALFKVQGSKFNVGFGASVQLYIAVDNKAKIRY